MPQMIDTATKVTRFIPQLQQLGVRYIWKYFNRLGPRQSKCWDRVEAAAATAARMKCMVTYEDYGATLGSFSTATGYASAKFSREFGHSELNLPPTTAVYFAVDLDPTPAQIHQYIIPYFEGAHNAFTEQRDLPPLVPAVYGCGNVIQALLATGLIRHHWLAGAMGWGGSRAFLASGKWQIRQGPKMEYNILPGLNVDEGSINPAISPDTIGSFTVDAATPTPLPDPAPTPSTDFPTLKKGSRGGEVAQLQQLLGVPADRVFGPVTEAAVKSFQEVHELTVDGIVGPLTWAALFEQRQGV